MVIPEACKILVLIWVNIGIIREAFCAEILKLYLQLSESESSGARGFFLMQPPLKSHLCEEVRKVKGMEAGTSMKRLWQLSRSAITRVDIGS